MPTYRTIHTTHMLICYSYAHIHKKCILFILEVHSSSQAGHTLKVISDGNTGICNWGKSHDPFLNHRGKSRDLFLSHTLLFAPTGTNQFFFSLTRLCHQVLLFLFRHFHKNSKTCTHIWNLICELCEGSKFKISLLMWSAYDSGFQ